MTSDTHQLEPGQAVKIDGMPGHWRYHSRDTHDPECIWVYGGSGNPNGKRQYRAVWARLIRATTTR